MDTLKGLGIVIEQSVPHQHQQNGQAERAIRIIMKKHSTYASQCGLLQSWWEFCINHTVYPYQPNSNCAPCMVDAYGVTS